MAGLFACTNCHSRHAFENLSKEDQLCKACRKKFPLVQCSYCRLEFHIFKKLHGVPVCTKCSYNIETYGEPKKCKYCQTNSAFKKSLCSHCSSSEKKYGKPLKCHQCKHDCAFKKNSQDTQIGRLLCLHCTIEHKRKQHKLEKQERKKNEKQDQSAKMSEKQEQNFSKISKALNTDKGDKEDMFVDPISNITKLRDQIASLKRSIIQKEKIILEKDKKIAEFQAETWEKDRITRQKIQGIQKEFNEQLESLKTENQMLKKQISSSANVKKTPKTNHPISRIRIEPDKLSNTINSERKVFTANTEENIINEVDKVKFEVNEDKANIEETSPSQATPSSPQRHKRHRGDDDSDIEEYNEQQIIKKKKCKVISDDEDESDNNLVGVLKNETPAIQGLLDLKETRSEMLSEPHSSDDEGTFQGFSDGEN